MLKSFYNYIVNDLLIGYFKKYPLQKGSRYFMIVENEKHRNMLMQALNDVCDKITISGIYQGNDSSVVEESYDTHVIKPSIDSSSIIIGYDKNSTEDYLTTIRNSVGVTGGKYENFGVIYVLSDSVLSSIITACQDLQAVGGPLHSSYIIRDIHEKAEDVISKDLERKYLDKHLNKISEYIADGTCNLFDFGHALSVLADQTLKGHYNDLDFFNDKAVYDGTYKPTDTEIENRVEKNHEIYRKISDIMNEDDDVDKLKFLQRLLDEKLSKKVVANTNSWKSIDFQEILDSIERKIATAKLELLDIELPSEGLLTSMVPLTKGNKKKRSTSYVVICDQSESVVQQVKITFNKEINKVASDVCKTQGQVLKITVGDALVKQSIGLNDNHHDFFMMKLPCNKSFFRDIEKSFSINKKGEIVVIVPEYTDVLTFGNGDELLSIPLDKKVAWTDNARLEVPVVDDEGNSQIDFFVDFGNKEVKFVLKLNIAKPIPPARPGTIEEGTFEGGEVVVDGSPRSVYSYWKKYLDWEDAFIKNDCSYIEYEYNELTGEYEAKYEKFELPNRVQETLTQMFAYFKNHNTIPSLCKMNDDLRILYKNYWNAVVSSINSIPNNRGLVPKEYYLTKLGIVSVSSRKRLYFSPFHPLLVAYALEYDNQYDDKEESAFAKKLLSPFYLIPYLYYNDYVQRPYTDKEIGEIHNWLSYEDVKCKPQERTNDITTKMVWTKIEAFIKHFNYLFQNKDCPIIISTIGIADDTNVIKGIVEFIRKQYSDSVQKIELHEYVDNLMEETFLEKLNRLDSIDATTRELESLNLKLESKGEYTSQEIIHQLFTRVSFYKHALSPTNGQIGYSHINFYLKVSVLRSNARKRRKVYQVHFGTPILLLPTHMVELFCWEWWNIWTNTTMPSGLKSLALRMQTKSAKTCGIQSIPQFGITECLIQHKCSVHTPPSHAIRSG